MSGTPELREALGRAQRANGEAGRTVTFTRASDIRPERTLWARDGRVPLGAVTLLVGRAGLGKTTMLIEDAARLSRGELGGDLHGQARTTLFATAEDTIASTLVPRLIAAEADRDRIEFVAVREADGLGGLVTLPGDVERIGERAEEVGASLVVVDPLVAFMHGKLDAHRDQDVRRALAPLAQLAEARTLALVAVVHLNKSQATVLLDRVSGSVGFGAAARSVLAFGGDPADPEGEAGSARVLVHAKCNLARLASSVAYRIEDRVIHAGDGERIPTSRAVELGPSDATADDLITAMTADERSALEEAVEWIRAEMLAGPRKAAEIEAEAKRAGIGESVLRKAKRKLHIQSERVGGAAGKGFWEWRMPKARV